MFKQFNLSSIQVDAINKEIVLKFNFDIAPNSVKGDSINLVTYDTGDHIPFKTKIDNEFIYLYLDEWPIPNTKYQIIVEKEITNIAGMQLNSSLRRQIVFKSVIADVPQIISPYNFERLDKIKISFQGNPKESYYIEIATENKFYNLIYQGKVYEKEISLELPDIEEKQYYVRARIEENGDIGQWCEPVTFIYKKVCDCDIPEEDGPSAQAVMPSPNHKWEEEFGHDAESSRQDILPDDNIEIEDILDVLTYPESGMTTNSFVFEFDRELDPDSPLEITIIRRDF